MYTAPSAGRDKLQSRKLGSTRAVKALTNWVYLIEGLVTGARKEAYVQCLELSRDKLLHVAQTLREYVKQTMK
jgi:hypothetical protein